MKLIFQSPFTIPSISKTLSILMDGSKVCVDDIQYDKVKGVVVFLMQRKELTGFSKSFLRGLQPIYSQHLINSVLTIKEVIEMDINFDDKLMSECNSCFTVLFGLNIDGNNLYLGSVEETQGNTLCQIFISVKHLDIEYLDKEEKTRSTSNFVLAEN